MSRQVSVLWLLVLWVGVLSLPVQAQSRMEVLPLHHRLAEDVVPVLQGMLEPGGVISSMSGKIIVRSSPANIEQIRAVLAGIDTPQRRLMITVRQGGQRSQSRTQLDAGVDLRLRGDELDARLRGSADSATRDATERVVSRVQTVDDGEAMILMGQAAPVRERQVFRGPDGVVVADSTRQVTAGSGFYARPRLAGNNVTVTVSPQSQRFAGRGRIEGSGLQTTVSGRLGEWIPLGGVSQLSAYTQSGYGRSGSGGADAESTYWIRVDALD